MGIGLWIAMFAGSSLFWWWVIYGGGAEWLEGSMIATFLIHLRAGQWSAEGIKAFGFVTWIMHTIVFLLGLAYPGIRADR